MNKQEIIEKYGQEAWERKKEASRMYRKNNPERVKESNRKYREQHKAERAGYNKQWFQEHEDYKRDYSKTKNYRALRLFHNYNRYDKDDGHLGNDLTKDYILEHIFNSSCIYCGDSDWRHLGCDRINNNLPHTKNNCVCACGVCNIERWYKQMSVEEFVEYRKTHPRELNNSKSPKMNIVEENGQTVIRKASL